MKVKRSLGFDQGRGPDADGQGLIRTVEWTWVHMGAVDIGVGGDGLWARWE